MPGLLAIGDVTRLARNVRELENLVARCVALGPGPTLRDEDGCLIPEETGNNTLAETDTHGWIR